MSTSFHPPSARARTELETVVNWPLLIAAAGLAILLLVVPVVLACIAALKGSAVQDEVVSRPALAPADAAPVAVSDRPLASFAPPAEAATPLPIYAEGRQRNKPAPVAAPVAAKPPPPLDPILQGPEVTEPPSPPLKRFDVSSEESLIASLAEFVKEVDLESVKGTREKLLSKPGKKTADRQESLTILALSRQRTDLKGLPLIGEADCRAGEEKTKKMAAISRELRNFIQIRRRSSGYERFYGVRELAPALAKRKEWFEDDGVSTVMQMLQVEEPSVRRGLVEFLAEASGDAASILLARHALFDVSFEVREKAIDMLKKRRREEYRQVLLDGFRYPWPPVAAHAAEALVALGDQAAVPRLAILLDNPDPRAPREDKNGKWVMKEVVRINHLRNCLLCHPPSTGEREPLRGSLPTPGEPLTPGYRGRRKDDFVRADVTYLRQDFSLMERVAKPDRWPALQRFDYVVRTRELTAEERAAHEKTLRKPRRASYPQREAVLFALRELTGFDAGETSADWHELLWAVEAGGGH